MSKEFYPHYNCNFCGKEVTEKVPNDVKDWINVSRGSHDFYMSDPLTIAYMRGEYMTNEKVQIGENLNFCSKECLVKFIYKHLKEQDVDKAVTDAKSNPKLKPAKPQKGGTEARFEGLEVVNSNDTLSDH
jgi:hypothetical protein